ncbi:MAG: hypothetical protein AAGF01_21445 [Cyanobacteria bacterium P01_G01_bin.38]
MTISTSVLSNGFSVAHTADSVLSIYPPRVTLDAYAQKALSVTEIEGMQAIFKTQGAAAKEYLSREGLLSTISSLTVRLNGSGLDDLQRLLLSSSDIYATLLEQAFTVDKVQSTDLEGLYGSVVRGAASGPRTYFLGRMVSDILNDKRIFLGQGSRYLQHLMTQVISQGLPITQGQVESVVNQLLTTVYNEGDIPYYVDKFALRSDSGIARSAFTSAIKQAMIDYLVKLGVQVRDQTSFEQGLYDEYFALAYSDALLKVSTVSEDPIDAARVKGGETTWDFSVDTFESIEEQGVSPDNILAAGALDYIYCIGERMHVFDVANALVLRWAGGVLDVPEGATAALLYRYHKLRSERSTPQERAMLYRRILNRGGGRLLSNMVANEDFPRLWHQLMSEVAEYIRKAEGSYSAESWVSRAPIFQATKNLQYNLSENMTGMSHLQVTEDYAHLQEALDIIKSEDVIVSYGGRRKSIWTVIEQLAKEDLGLMISSAPIRTAAIEGNKVFQWIASFNEGTVQDRDFQTFLAAAESWIIAQASMEEEDDSFGREDDDIGDDFDEEEDDWDDWDD